MPKKLVVNSALCAALCGRPVCHSRGSGNPLQTREFHRPVIENREQISSNPVLLYMKGSPNQPQCGFSQRASQAIMACGKRFAYVDILANPDIRATLPEYANWPTFPQLWVNGELVGGCDIICEMYDSGELQDVINSAVPE